MRNPCIPPHEESLYNPTQRNPELGIIVYCCSCHHAMAIRCSGRTFHRTQPGRERGALQILEPLREKTHAWVCAKRVKGWAAILGAGSSTMPGKVRWTLARVSCGRHRVNARQCWKRGRGTPSRGMRAEAGRCVHARAGRLDVVQSGT